MRRHQLSKSSSSSYSSVTQSSVTSGSEKSLNRHGYYVDKAKVPPPEDRRPFNLGAAQRRRQLSQWDDQGSSRGFVGRETGRGSYNPNDHSVHPSSGSRRHVSSSSSFSTDSELSHGKGSMGGNPRSAHGGGYPSGGASYQTFLDERASVPMPVPADEILMNLGLSDSFIPKRFLYDWVEKNRRLQAENRQRASQQWIEERVNACLHQMAQQSSEDGFSSENFESSDTNEDGSNNAKRYSVADDACGQGFSAGESVSLHSRMANDIERDAQKASQLKSVLDRRSKLLLGNQQDKLREQRLRQFASHRSLSSSVLLEVTTPDWSATTRYKTSAKVSIAAIPEVDSKLLRPVSPNKDHFGVSEHRFVAKVYTETNEHEDSMIPIKDETQPELPSIVVRNSSLMFLHVDSLEVNDILANRETNLGDSAFQPMLHPMLSLSRNSSLSSSNCSAVGPSPVTVIEVGCSIARNDIANMSMLGSSNEKIFTGDTSCDIECSSGCSSVSATYYDARQWPSSVDVRQNSANEESHSPAVIEVPRCTSVPAYLPSFKVDEFSAESLFRDSHQNLYFDDEDGLFYCSQSTDDGSQSLSVCADYQESVGVPSNWSVLGSDGDEEPTARDFTTQTPASWHLACVSTYVSKYITPLLCGKCQYYIMRTCPSHVLSPIQWDSDDLMSPSSLCRTFGVGNIADVPIPSQNGVTENQVTEDRADSLFTASNGGAIHAPERAPLNNQRRVGRSAFVKPSKE